MKGQTSFDPNVCPWNRQQRRRHERSKGVILRLYSGKDSRSWLNMEWHGYEVINVDIVNGAQYDMHSIGTWSYLCHLARRGKVVAVVGGPPCRSVSRLRHRGPGPRPVRGRDERRFGLPDLSSVERDLVVGDLALLLKQAGLWIMASEARNPVENTENICYVPPAFLMESPRDPVSYMQQEALEQDMASYWNFREVKDLAQLMKASFVTLDQGPIGHIKRKPTTLMVANLPDMLEFQGISGDGTGQEVAGSLQGRLIQSRGWSAWAPGLVAAIQESLKRYVQRLDAQGSGPQDQEAAVCRLDMEGWKTHVRNQHQPFRRDCRRCMEMMGSDVPHRRTMGDRAAHCLSYDIVGPMPVGDDLGLGPKARHMMVATVAIPRLPREQEEIKEMEELDGEEGELLPIEDGEGAQDDGDPEQGEVSDEQVEQIDVTKVATRIYCRFKAMGMQMLRVHTDRECAFLPKSFQPFCRRFGMHQTMTEGDEGPSNGRIEAEVHQVKRRLRLLIKESGLEERWWPGIARYVGEERLRRQCAHLGVPSAPLLPIGGRATVKTKRWHRAGFGPLTPPFRTMTLMGPSPFMSQGYVLFDSGHVQHARVAVQTDPTAERAVLELQAVQDPERPHQRVVGKRPMEPVLPQLPPPRLSDDPGLCTIQRNSAGEPVLSQGRTGGESLQLSMPPGAHVKVNGGGKALVCKECGLQMAQASFKRLDLPQQCGFCETPMDDYLYSCQPKRNRGDKKQNSSTFRLTFHMTQSS